MLLISNCKNNLMTNLLLSSLVCNYWYIYFFFSRETMFEIDYKTYLIYFIDLIEWRKGLHILACQIPQSYQRV